MAACPPPVKKGLVALFKQGWNEIPEILGSGFMGLIGIGLTTISIISYYKRDGDNRLHRYDYTVIRHDDPRAACVRKS